MDRIRTNYQTLPLVTRSKGLLRVPPRSGLNWGQRPGRSQDQAYIAVPTYVQRSEFFPAKGEEFSLEWDDGELHTCVRAQQNGKAIQTPKKNTILGAYLRARLGVESGDPVVIDHLLKYGRTDVEVFKDSDYRYYADFSRSGKR